MPDILVYPPLAGTVKEVRLEGKKTIMTPAAFLQTDIARETFAATRREEAIRLLRSPRRVTSAFINSDAQTPLFHAWRP